MDEFRTSCTRGRKLPQWRECRVRGVHWALSRRPVPRRQWRRPAAQWECRPAPFGDPGIDASAALSVTAAEPCPPPPLPSPATAAAAALLDISCAFDSECCVIWWSVEPYSPAVYLVIKVGVTSCVRWCPPAHSLSQPRGSNAVGPPGRAVVPPLILSRAGGGSTRRLSPVFRRPVYHCPSV